MFLGGIHHNECSSALTTFSGTKSMNIAIHRTCQKTIATHKAHFTVSSVVVQTIKRASVSNNSGDDLYQSLYIFKDDTRINYETIHDTCDAASCGGG